MKAQYAAGGLYIEILMAVECLLYIMFSIVVECMAQSAHLGVLGSILNTVGCIIVGYMSQILRSVVMAQVFWSVASIVAGCML